MRSRFLPTAALSSLCFVLGACSYTPKPEVAAAADYGSPMTTTDMQGLADNYSRKNDVFAGSRQPSPITKKPLKRAAQPRIAMVRFETGSGEGPGKGKRSGRSNMMSRVLATGM